MTPPPDAPAVAVANDAAEGVAVRGISKRFWGTVALDGVDLDITPGSIRALLGQNGAGKSTLIKILAGVYEEDAGTITLAGHDPRLADPSPLAFIHQDRGLVPGMSIAENVALVRGYARRGLRLISWSRVVADAYRALELVDLDVDPRRDVAELTLVERSLIAIGRALASNAQFIVLDEPTAALPASLVEQLVSTIKRLRDRGVGFLYVSHRIDEVFQLADFVTTLRDGRVVQDEPLSRTTQGDLVAAIVGHSLHAPARPVSHSHGGTSVITLDGLVFTGVGPVALQTFAGEILGLVGLSGAGQSEIGRAIAGVLRPAAGSMQLSGHPYAPKTTTAALAAGVGFVAGDRLAESLAPDLTVQENLYMNPAVTNHPVLRPQRRRAEQRRCLDALERYDVRPPDPTTPIDLLSGGNQQKVVVARWLEAELPVLVLEEPTAGVDIGAKEQVHDLLREGATHGGTAIVVSSDFDEVVQLCTRVLVFSRGTIVTELSGREIRVDELTAWATGAKMLQASPVQELSRGETT